MTEVLCGHIFILVLPICVVRKPCALEQDSSPLLQYPKLDTSCILLLKRSVFALCFLALSLWCQCQQQPPTPLPNPLIRLTWGAQRGRTVKHCSYLLPVAFPQTVRRSRKVLAAGNEDVALLGGGKDSRSYARWHTAIILGSAPVQSAWGKVRLLSKQNYTGRWQRPILSKLLAARGWWENCFSLSQWI